MCTMVGCKPENTVGWRSMNKTPSRPVGTEKDVKYEEKPCGGRGIVVTSRIEKSS